MHTYKVLTMELTRQEMITRTINTLEFLGTRRPIWREAGVKGTFSAIAGLEVDRFLIFAAWVDPADPYMPVQMFLSGWTSLQVGRLLRLRARTDKRCIR